MAHRLHPRIDENDVIELVGQILLGAHEVDGRAHREMLRHRDDLALHHPAGGFLRIAQRLLDGDPVRRLERLEDLFLLRLLQILDQVDDIVAVQIAHGVAQHVGRQQTDDLLADRFLKLRQDLPVEIEVVELHQPAPVIGADLFEKVGDVGRVQRLHQLDELFAIARVHRIEDRRDRPPVERIGVFVQRLLDLLDRVEFGLFAHLVPLAASPGQ